MARLVRIVAAGLPHHVVQRGHDGQPIVRDDEDRRVFLALLAEAAAAHQVDLHAWVLLDDHVHLVATPRAAASLSRMMQAFGRRYVAAFNRRHHRSGTLWSGRFRCALLQPERWVVDAMRYVEQHPVRTGVVDDRSAFRWSSLAHHLGTAADPMVSDSPAFWALGNTPFEREAAYRRLVDTALAPSVVAEITAATRRGIPLASADFVRSLDIASDAMLVRRPRGRPRRGTSG
jgi:putative transposase